MIIIMIAMYKISPLSSLASGFLWFFPCLTCTVNFLFFFFSLSFFFFQLTFFNCSGQFCLARSEPYDPLSWLVINYLVQGTSQGLACRFSFPTHLSPFTPRQPWGPSTFNKMHQFSDYRDNIHFKTEITEKYKEQNKSITWHNTSKTATVAILLTPSLYVLMSA